MEMRLWEVPGVFLLLSAGFIHLSLASDKDCINGTDYTDDYVLCIGRPDTVEVGKNTSFYVKLLERVKGESDWGDVTANLSVRLEHPEVASLSEDMVELAVGENVTVVIHSVGAGRSIIQLNCSDGVYNTSTCPFSEDTIELFQREVSFAHSHPLDIVIAVVGWIYFMAWSVSFYPQIFLNFYRRSVIGLNFDFLALNITGFLAYAAFNVGLFWSPTIYNEYFKRHPAGVNPVQLNDVIFSLHAVAATAFTIFQCFIFKRGGQRVSYTAMVLLLACWLTLVISLFVSVGGKLEWLDYLYVASYVKLAITLLKYIPQAWFNCRRRSTVGWSIGNVLLDFTGGTFSILQMFLLSYNYDDWKSIFGDPTKFGLGLFSIMFDLLFMLQHYVLFRNPPNTEGYKKIEDEFSDDNDLSPPPKVNEGDHSPSISDEERPLLGKKKKRSKIMFWKTS